jgi:hypothetical protein
LLRHLSVAATCLAVLLLAPAGGAADGQVLTGTVGPGFTITLIGPDGAAVTHLDPGHYTIQVDDRADLHDFHLVGPGVDMSTAVEFVGAATWDVNLVDGTYRFFCDPHQTVMKGSFTVGNATPPPTPTPKPKPATLVATAGPGVTVTLKTAAGRPVKALTAGRYAIEVRDRSARDNFHLSGPGVNRRTGVGFRGSSTWTLRLGAGTFRYRSDAHPSLGGSFRVH